MRKLLFGLIVFMLIVAVIHVEKVSAASDPRLGVDLILHNGKIVTVDKKFSIAEAVAIGRGRILGVGKNQEIQAMAGPNTQMVDLRGKTVIPGLIDSHIHINSMVSLLTTGLPISHVKSIADIVKVAEEGVKKAKPGGWVITAKDWRESQVKENRLPTRWELDPVSPNNPVCVQRTGHMLIVNSYALKLLGITKDTVPVAGGSIDKDPKTGEPTGVLRDAQQEVVRKMFPPVTYEDELNAIRESFRILASVGLTGAMTNDDDGLLRHFLDLYSKKEIPIRMALAIRPKLDALISGTEEKMKTYSAMTPRVYGGYGGTLLSIEPIGEENFDTDGQDISTMSIGELKRILLLAHKYSLRLQTHQSTDLNLKAFEMASREVNFQGRRWIALHCNAPSTKSMDLLRKLEMYVVTQPSRVYYATKDPLNVPLRDFADRGIIYCLGTDWPSDGRESHSPFRVIYSSVTRKDRHGKVHFPENSITREEALKGYTINNAMLTFEEKDKGSIEVGKLADLLILSDDILTCREEKIKDIYVLKTILGGEVVYERK
jgi:predicted amidohydrolase YtcJ